jgi:hypothetical protein
MLLANLFAIDSVALNRHADAFKSFGLRGNTARQGVTHSDSGFSRCRRNFDDSPDDGFPGNRVYSGG